MKDGEVFEIAQEEERIIISGDDDFKAKDFKYNCGIIWFTDSAKRNINIVEKITWIINHIDNYAIDLNKAFISIRRNEYYIWYKKGMNNKLKEKNIKYEKIKDFKKD